MWRKHFVTGKALKSWERHPRDCQAVATDVSRTRRNMGSSMVSHDPSPRAGAGDRHCVLVVDWLDLTLFVSDIKLESCGFLLLYDAHLYLTATQTGPDTGWLMRYIGSI